MQGPKTPAAKITYSLFGFAPVCVSLYISAPAEGRQTGGGGGELGGGKGGGRFIEIEKRGGVEDLRSIAILQPSRDSCNGRPPSWASFLITGKGPHCFCLNQRKKSTPLLRKEQRACPLPSLHTHTHYMYIYVYACMYTSQPSHPHTLTLVFQIVRKDMHTHAQFQTKRRKETSG